VKRFFGSFQATEAAAIPSSLPPAAQN